MRLIHLTFGFWAMLAGCVAEVGPAGPTPRMMVDLPRSPISLTTFTLAGPPSPATIAVRLQLPYRALAKTVAADLKSLTFALVVWPLASSPAGATDLTPVGSLFSYDTGAATGSVTFGNVPANADGETYHIVVAAFDHTAGAGTNITNATGSDADTGRARLAGIDGTFYVSESSVRVAPTSYVLSTSTAIDISLKLLD